MPLTNLNQKLFSVSGILSKLNYIKTVLEKLRSTGKTEAEIESITHKKLAQVRSNLKAIFFEPVSKLSSDYPAYKHALNTLLSDKTVDEMIQDITESTLTDWIPDPSSLMTNYQELNQRHGYFQSIEQSEELSRLFIELVVACRKVAVLVERSSMHGDNIPCVYAYNLMALLIDESKAIPTFQSLAKKIDKLLTPKDKQLAVTAKPFHDVLLDLKLPDKSHDREGWLQLIEKEGTRVLPFFSIAVKIEEKMHKHAAPKTFSQAQKIAALCLYDRASEDTAFAQLCYVNQVEESTFDACLDFIGNPPVWPKKATDSIPDMTIETPEEDYVWTKLPASDKRGLILGKMTDCCQSIGDHSEQCVKDAVSLNDNALYVLLKRKKSKKGPCLTDEGSINDDCFQLIGQSYVWTTKAGNLCLDSIECLNNSIPADRLLSILTDFSEAVLQQHPTIQRVTLGTGGKTPEDLFPNVAAIAEAMREGDFYGDASQQYIIQQKASRLSSTDSETIKSIYPSSFCKPILYLCEHLLDTTHVVEQLAALVKANPSLPASFSTNDLFNLLRFTPQPTLDDLMPVNWDAPLDQISTGRLIWQANTLKKKLIALPHLSSEDRFAVLTEKDSTGETVLYHASDCFETLKTALELLPEDTRLKALTNKSISGDTILDAVAARNPELLDMVLSLLSEEARITAVNAQGGVGCGILSFVTQNPRVLEMVLKRLPEEARLAALIKHDQQGNLVLHKIAHAPETLEMVLKLLPEDARLTAAKEKDRAGRTLLHHAAGSPETLKMVLELYPEHARLAAVNEKDVNGLTVLHYAVGSPETLKMVLELYPEHARLDAVKEKTLDGRTLLHDVAVYPETLKMILELYPAHARLAAVNEKDANGLTVLHHAAGSPETLRTVLELLPEETRFAALTEKDTSGDTLLNQAHRVPEMLSLILELLPEDARLAVIKEKNAVGQTILHQVANNPKTLKMVLELYPENERLAAITEEIPHNLKIFGKQTVFQIAKKDSEGLNVVLTSLSIDSLSKLLKSFTAKSLVKEKYDLFKDIFIRKLIEQGHPETTLSSLQSATSVVELQWEFKKLSQHQFKRTLENRRDHGKAPDVPSVGPQK